jgi:hypothetical protein
VSLDPAAQPEYLVGHLEDALARDPRVTEQGLRVRVEGETPTVIVTGTVVAAHKAAIAEVVRELLPGAALRDETAVADYPEPADVEEVS